MSRRSLVTGGAGFIGSHLCEKLLARGHEVLCVDNYFTGRRSNIIRFLNNSAFEILRHDVCEPLNVEVDEIYNLACPASPVHYQDDPIQTTRTNVLGAINMLDLADRLKIRILQASTSEIYGDPAEHPQSENYAGNVNVTGPRACYDEGKRCAETLFYDFRRQRGLSIRVARIFNTYGPRMLADDGRVVSNFIVQALRDRPISIYGDGSQTRSFCYVDDLVDGLIALMDCRDDDVGPVNLGSPREITIKNLANMIVEIVGSKTELDFGPLPSDDPARRCPDISRATQVLGWRPLTGLHEGIERTVEGFRTETESG